MTTRAKISPGDGDVRHGTRNGYTNLRCRCDLCREAQRIGMAEYNRDPAVRDRHNASTRKWRENQLKSAATAADGEA